MHLTGQSQSCRGSRQVACQFGKDLSHDGANCLRVLFGMTGRQVRQSGGVRPLDACDDPAVGIDGNGCDRSGSKIQGEESNMDELETGGVLFVRRRVRRVTISRRNGSPINASVCES
ncbi:MAG: hypothetical protein CM1200mP2_55180 [Planctomycetaceae bacterium]|nr:MAG: hypothetical protein CM1200mP2_55180 [Planctomycetaceae bacterium]